MASLGTFDNSCDELGVGELEQIRRFEFALPVVDYLPGDRLPTAIRLATAGDKNQTARLGLEPLRKRKRLREIELGDDPGHVRRRPQCSVGLRRDGRKNNRGVGKEEIPMPEDER